LSLLSGFSSHSQTVMQCQPIFANLFCSSLSRSLLRLIFFFQKSVFVLGNRKYLQPSCPCQKQPLTNTHVRYLRSTTSGWPGSRGLFSLYRNPCLHRYLRTRISGFVFAERIETIFLCRCCGDKESIFAQRYEKNLIGIERKILLVVFHIIILKKESFFVTLQL